MTPAQCTQQSYNSKPKQIYGYQADTMFNKVNSTLHTEDNEKAM